MNIPTEDFVSDSFKIAEMRAEPDMFIGSDGNDIGTVHVQTDRRNPCVFQRSHHGRSQAEAEMRRGAFGSSHGAHDRDVLQIEIETDNLINESFEVDDFTQRFRKVCG